MCDIRTGRTVSTSSRLPGLQDLLGNYPLYTRDDRAVRLRNLLTGTETVPRVQVLRSRRSPCTPAGPPGSPTAAAG